MDSKKLAEALRGLARLMWQDDPNGSRIVDDAAAACEEEGTSDADLELKRRQEITEHNVEYIAVIELTRLREQIAAMAARQDALGSGVGLHGDRIAALEATIGRRDTVLGSAVARIAALEEWRTNCANVENVQRLLAEAGVLPPPAPEERCVKCSIVLRHHPPASRDHAFTSAPSPERAQETCGFRDGVRICSRPKGHPGEHDDDRIRAAVVEAITKPPEQARRTWSNVTWLRHGAFDTDAFDPPITVTELRPGERIVKEGAKAPSGQG